MVLSKVKFIFFALLILQAILFSERSHAAEPLVFSVHPYLPSVELFKRFTPLVDYLSRETGLSITLNIASSYDEHIEDIGKGKTNILQCQSKGEWEICKHMGRPEAAPMLAVRKPEKGQTGQPEGTILISPKEIDAICREDR